MFYRQQLLIFHSLKVEKCEFNEKHTYPGEQSLTFPIYTQTHQSLSSSFPNDTHYIQEYTAGMT